MASVESLLAAVVEASRCMVVHEDVEQGIRAAVAVLGEGTGFDRAYVFEVTSNRQTVVMRYQWAAPGYSRVTDITGLDSYSIDDFQEVFRPLFANEVYQSVSAERTGANLELNEAIGTRSDVMVPIFVDGHFWGLIGFDNCREARRYSEAEVQALRGAASAIAAALHRQRLQGLVRGVQAFLAHLLGPPALEAGLTLALQALREHTGLDRIFVNRYDPSVQGTWPWCESRAPGVPAFVDGFGPGPYPDADYPELALPLLQGRVYRSLAPERSGLNAAANVVNDSGSDLIVPVMVAGRYRACIGCDDGRATRQWSDDEVSVLQGAAQALAAAIERSEAEQTRLRTERELARQAQAAALALTQREAWLMAVTRAAQVLLNGNNFDQAAQEALGILGVALEAPRIALVQDLPTPADTEPGRWQVTHEWFIARLAPQIGSPLESGPYPSVAWWQALRSGRHAVLRSDFDPEWAERGNAICATPIPGAQRRWLTIGFDGLTRTAWSEEECAVLEAAAACFGAAIERRAGEQARAAEAAQRALRTERHTRLLAAVAQSAAELLAAAELAPCLDRVLQRIGEVSHAQRVCLAWLTWTPEHPLHHGWQEIGHEWTRPGELRQIDGPERKFPMRRDDQTWAMALHQLQRHRRLLARMADLAEPFRSAQMSLGVVWSLVAPVVVDGDCVALLGFDHATPLEDYEEADLAALQTVASTIGAALQRDATQQALLAERERRLAAEQARADESAQLADLLEGVVRNARGLIAADAADFETAMLAWLGSFGARMQAQRATLYDVVNFEATGGMTVRMLCEWVRPGTAGSIPVSFDAPYVIDPRGAEALMERLLSGDAAVFHTERIDGPMQAFMAAQGNASVLAVPIFIGDRQWGSLSFDFAQFTEPAPAVVAVLQTAADTLAAVLQRLEVDRVLSQHQQRALRAERQRAHDAHVLSELLEGVLRASRALQEGENLNERLRHWLQHLAEAVDADVALLIDFPAERGAAIAHWACEWRKSGELRPAPAIPTTTDFLQWADRLRQGEPVWAHLEDLQDPRSVSFWRATDCATNLLVPVRVGAAVEHVLCFDWREHKAWQPAFGVVLNTAAEGLAAALQRHAAMQEALCEREARIALAQQQATGLDLANRALLRATQSLTDAAPLEDFLAAVMLEAVGICGARSAGVFLYDEVSCALRMVAFVCDGQQVDITSDPRMVMWRQQVPAGIVHRWVPALRAHDHLAFDNRLPAEQHPWPVSREWHAAFGHTHVIDIPLFAGGQLVGVLGQCFCGDEAFEGFNFSQSRALGHLAALAIRQQALADAARWALLASERERAERERLSELTAASDALRSTMDALAEAADESVFLHHCLQAIAARAGATAVWLFRESTDDGLMRLVGSSRDGHFSETGEAGDPPDFLQGFHLNPHIARRLAATGRLIWRLTDEAQAHEYRDGTLAWHRRQGHVANALHALTVGERVVGLVGMVFVHPTAPSERQQEQVHALCQPLALALELMRQGRIARRSAEEAAVLMERNRLAREIHDGIAQTFLAIQMQLDTADLKTDTSPALQAITLARHGLNEARRAVAALRPYDLGGRDLPSGLQRMLLRRLAGSGIEVQVELPACWVALPPETEDHLFRIAQEAINNVLKHAGASQLRLELSQAAGETTVLISDNGRGFDPADLTATRGYGLEGMQQRALRAGARIDVLSQPRLGTQVLVSWTAPTSPSVTAGSLDAPD